MNKTIFGLGVLIIALSGLLFLLSPLFGALGLVFGIVLLVYSLRTKSPENKNEGSVAPSVSPSPAPVPADEMFFFSLSPAESASSLFKSRGVPNETYSFTKSQLVDEGYIEERVYKYEAIEDVPEISEGSVFLDGVLVGTIKRNDRRKVEDLVSSGAPFTVGIYGGPYKIILEDWDDEKSEECYEMEKDESPVGATLRIKK